MELEELIENTLRRKHLEEMMNRPEKEHRGSPCSCLRRIRTRASSLMK